MHAEERPHLACPSRLSPSFSQRLTTRSVVDPIIRPMTEAAAPPDGLLLQRGDQPSGTLPLVPPELFSSLSQRVHSAAAAAAQAAILAAADERSARQVRGRHRRNLLDFCFPKQLALGFRLRWSPWPQACDEAQKALHVATRQVARAHRPTFRHRLHASHTQVIDTGLALAKPRECKDDAGVQVQLLQQQQLSLLTATSSLSLMFCSCPATRSRTG
jgi:hypothetical protein